MGFTKKMLSLTMFETRAHKAIELDGWEETTKPRGKLTKKEDTNLGVEKGLLGQEGFWGT